MTIKVLIVDSRPVVRPGIQMFLDPELVLDFMAEKGTVEEATQIVRSLQSDIVLSIRSRFAPRPHRGKG